MDNLEYFAEKYLLARQTLITGDAGWGSMRFRNRMEPARLQFRPLFTIGVGPSQQSFVDICAPVSSTPVKPVQPARSLPLDDQNGRLRPITICKEQFSKGG
jgi:hypothetical protein